MEDQEVRWILHLDMDAFFASVEQLDNPDLRGKPVIIGGDQRGVVSTASYEARRYGVRSAMPMFQARKLCPYAVFLRGRMARYVEKSTEVMTLLQQFSPYVEKASVDEAYLDASGLEHIFGSVEEMARKLQQEVYAQSGLTCSVGLAPVKFLAKIASDMQKPAGLTIIAHADVPALLRSLPVGKIPGVGPSLLKSLELLGVQSAADVQRYPRSFWVERMGRMGEVLFERGHGIDSRPVVPYTAPKSESAENTFEEDTMDRELLSSWLLQQAERVGRQLRKQGLKGKTVTVKYKFADFTQRSKSRTLKRSTNLTKEIYETALALLDESRIERPLRLIGVGVSHFGEEDTQLSLLPQAEDMERKREKALDDTLDSLREKYGKNAVMRGRLFAAKGNKEK